MTHRLFFFFCALSLFTLGLSPAGVADTSHARIVRLSLVQGDVRFAPSFHDDPLTDANAGWQAAPLNLPIRQGYVLATDNGRAEVEFENGAMAFLGANTVIEFYDLSLQDGDRVTRLILRQGTTTVYVNPANGDYFSVTGGDFTVEAAGRTTFRLDNFDDGSTVSVEQGQAKVLREKQSTPLSKGQSLSIHANDPGDMIIGRATDTDDFDRWVSGRIDSVVTATAYSSQYVNSPGYSAGFADLYTYGSWFPLAGYGYGWRPFGMGFGWSPFDYGSWYADPFFGTSFIGSAPWGWLPYHYGGWVFSPMYGWVWTPVGFGYYGGPLYYRPVTAVWVRNGTNLGIVPLHPADKFGKTAQNLSQGVYPVENSAIARSSIAAAAVPGSWSVLKQAPSQVLASNLTASTAPTRVSRTILAGPSTSNRVIALSRESSISYDPVEHRYVNSGNPTSAQQAEVREELNHTNGTQAATNAAAVHETTGAASPAKPEIPRTPATARMTTSPRPPAIPAPAHSAGSEYGGGALSRGGSMWGGSGSSSHASSGAAASHPSGGGGAHPH